MDNSVKISEQDLQGIVQLMAEYRKIHSEITELEKMIEDLMFKKDLLITDLDLLRGKEGMFMADLSYKYGEGKFDALTMSWVKTKEVKEEQ